ncbi:MAG: DUF4293 family protein [Sphingobacteriales bacterium]|nr:MAG: DUF4293 family protein [Sphingobacteriales bacterium]
MIQRVQSIWLLLATIALVLMLFLPIAAKETNSSESEIFFTRKHERFY